MGIWSLNPNGMIRPDVPASARSSCSIDWWRPATASTCTPARARADTLSTSGPKPQPLSIISAQKAAAGTPSAARESRRDGAA